MKNLLSSLVFLALAAVSLPSHAAVRVLDADLIEGVNVPRNYIKNSGAEKNVIGCSAYADAAAASPVDGTGGSPTLTVTRTTSSPLEGAGSFLITKDAANRQGEGVGCAFTIERAQLAKVLTVSFDYEVASGTYDAGSDTTDPDLTAWVYGPTDGTAVLTQLAPSKILGVTASSISRFQASFQTAATGSVYRLILHEAKTGTSAYTLKLDRLSVSPDAKSYGAPVTDWTAYTLTITATTSNPGLGTVTTNLAKWRRVGDSMEIRYDYLQTAAGTAGSGVYKFSIPSGYTIDTAKVKSGTNGNGTVGAAEGFSTADGYGTGVVWANGSTDLSVDIGTATTATNRVQNSYYDLSNASLRYSFHTVVPITGWSSTVQMSNDTAANVIAASYNTDTATSFADATETTVPYEDLVEARGSYTYSAAGVFTAAVPGVYRFSNRINLSSGVWTAGDSAYLGYRKNGGTTQILMDYRSEATHTDRIDMRGGATVALNAGDTIEIRAFQNNTANVAHTLAGSSTYNAFQIERISGPAQIAASDTVAAKAYATQPTGTIASTLASSTTTIWGSVEYDRTGSYNSTTGEFTCPIAGLYTLTGQTSVAGTESADNVVNLGLYKDGALVNNQFAFARVWASAVTSTPVLFTFDVYCVAGSVLTIRVASTITTPTYVSAAGQHWLQIKRFGN